MILRRGRRSWTASIIGRFRRVGWIHPDGRGGVSGTKCSGGPL